MKYVKQNFISGQLLKAEHLNHIEDGIVNSHKNIPIINVELLTREEKLDLVKNRTVFYELASSYPDVQGYTQTDSSIARSVRLIDRYTIIKTRNNNYNEPPTVLKPQIICGGLGLTGGDLADLIPDVTDEEIQNIIDYWDSISMTEL